MSSNLKIKNGDLLNATEDVIVHQCNCVTNYPKGLSKAIFLKWPYADVYTVRSKTTHRDVPGTITIRSKEGLKTVVNLFGQFYPSKPKYKNDTSSARLEWFKNGLADIVVQLPHINSVALPYKIGCGLAGGQWSDYLEILTQFARQNPSIDVCIYKLE